ncbi:MAG: radical SAM family heme chaperone HemW [Cellulophaga sp.]
MSGIYIHIPFCKQACHYCDFHFSTTTGKKQEMVLAIQKELELRKDEFLEEKVKTIYFGGGTPSLLETEEITAILNTVCQHYNVVDKPEITLEANPDDLSDEKLKALSETPINRLSIGIQSFLEEDLKLMNRAHSEEEAVTSITKATQLFDNISIDLIYGMPNMDEERWRQNIKKALSFKVAHISSYALTVEPKTALASFVKKGTVSIPSDAVSKAHYYILLEEMEKAGYVCYEFSNFGLPGYFSENNTAYWLGKKYLGIGPSAHSYDGRRRGWNINSNPKYIKAIFNGELPMEVEILSKADQYNEYIMTGLRTIWGVSLTKIRLEYGEKYYAYLLEQGKKHLQDKFLKIEDTTLVVTKKGKFLSDGIASDLFLV